MSLLQSEDFAIYQLRTAYLTNIRDGVGERLINVDASFLADPAFKAAGWAPNTAEIKRTYSPPIPTAISSQYFQAPPPSAGAGAEFGDVEDEGGLVTGVTSNDAVGPAVIARRRRRKEIVDEDDSSDLSDESDDEMNGTSRPANLIRFAKMPSRNRSGSSPGPDSSHHDGPSLMVTSPSRPPDSQRLRRGSLGTVEAIKARARRDTTTSSEISSENDLDPSVFQRQKISGKQNTKPSNFLSERIGEDPDEQAARLTEMRLADSDAESDSSLESEFSGDGELLTLEDVADNPVTSSPLVVSIPRATNDRKDASKKTRQAPDILQDLPPARPISVMQPISALGLAIKAKNKKPVSPFDRFTAFSGIGGPNPLNIKLYTPFSTKPGTPIEMYIRRTTTEGAPVLVAEAIGFGLWRYSEDAMQPPITGTKMNVNCWTLRIVEDGEVDFDFPALGRTRPISDFTSNNNRVTRARARDKPWDEFALVEATEAQLKENESLTPNFSEEATSAQESATTPAAAPSTSEDLTATTSSLQPVPYKSTSSNAVPRQNPIIEPRVANTALRKDTSTALDAPATPTSHATPRTGAPKTLNIHFTDHEFTPHVLPLEVTTDTYISEVFDQICKKLNVDKGLFVLRVTGTSTVAPTDRTVEALGQARSSLDLARRRFIGDGAFGLSGSPGSTSPNAPLFLTTSSTLGTAKKGGGHSSKKGVLHSHHPLAQQAHRSSSDVWALPTPLSLSTVQTTYRRYNVLRKQPMSFASSHPRVLALDGEYLHIMPGDTSRAPLEAAAQGKTTTIHFSSVVGCKVSRKHNKSFRLVVFKERETKRYDFEAANGAAEAAEIVAEIWKGVQPFKTMMGG